jgi:catechol 2,3-dioxygenase-like lactoylglutathione lyase family enzyme
MSDAVLTGVHHVKFAVRDLEKSIEWYERVFGFKAELEFPDEDGVVRGVAGSVPGLGDTGLALRQNPEVAGFHGFDPVSFGIADEAAAHAWAAHLDELGVEHSGVQNASIGWILVFHDPDGTEIHLYSFAAHGIDTSKMAGHARPRG